MLTPKHAALAAALVLSGAYAVLAAESPAPAAHEHHAPHQGTLVELGEEHAHLELVLDNVTGTLKAYALDGEAEQPVRLTMSAIPMQIVLDPAKGSTASQRHDLSLAPVANPLTGETASDTSEYRVRSDHLKGITRFDAVILEISIRGAAFTNVGFRFPAGNDSHVK